jgi:sulfonate transport system permease protein
VLNRLKQDFFFDSVFSWAKSILLCISLWTVLSYLPGVNSYIAKPQNVLNIFLTYNDIFSTHTFATLKTSLFGFTLGAFFAIISTVIVVVWKRSESLFSLLALIIYSIPLIAAAPLAALIFQSSNTGTALGCIGAYLPIFLSGTTYSNRISRNLDNISKGFGAGKLAHFRFIRLPLMYRGWLSGAQSGWLWAVLGALLGEFTGSRWGLGTFLTGSIVQGDINKVWAVVVLCLFVSMVGILLLNIIAKFSLLESKYDTIEISTSNLTEGLRKSNYFQMVFNGLIILAIWQLLSWTLDMNGGIFAGPIDILNLCIDIFNGKADLSFGSIFTAFGSTWLISLFGVILSLFIAFTFATSQLLFPLVSRPIILGMLITQVTPIVAFIPFIAFYLGRGTASVITIVILSTVYPAYIIFKKSFKETSKNALELAKGFGAKPSMIFYKIQFPFAAWMSIIAFKLAIGRAILGAITAEYLLTGKGLGGLLGQTRHQLDFRIVWLICLMVAIATLITDKMLEKIKHIFQSKFQKSNN